MHCYVLHPSVAGVVAQEFGGTARKALTAPHRIPEAAPPMGTRDADGATNPLDFDTLASTFAPPSVGAGAAAGTTCDASNSCTTPTASSGSPAAIRQRTPQASETAKFPTLASANTDNTVPSARRRLQYNFDKAFHVSPFMGLDHTYKWLFTEPGDTLVVQSQNDRKSDGARMFNAQLRLRRVDLSALTLLWVVLFAFPFLTWRLQWWIHYEAFWVWWKGVEFYPHPTGATNTFTRVVAALFTPIVLLAQGWAFIQSLMGRLLTRRGSDSTAVHGSAGSNTASTLAPRENPRR